MKPARSILGLPICCWPNAAWWLFKGITWGWAAVCLDRSVLSGSRTLIWRCWYWPGYVHPWRYDMPCKHDRCTTAHTNEPQTTRAPSARGARQQRAATPRSQRATRDPVR